MLSDRRPILLTNARILDPSRDLDFAGDLLIADGLIRDSKRGIGAAGVPEGTEIVDCRDKIVAPGLIDLRAFVGEPGAEYRETLASASQAAAAGGVTTIVCQPDTNPPIDEPPPRRALSGFPLAVDLLDRLFSHRPGLRRHDTDLLSPGGHLIRNGGSRTTAFRLAGHP